VSEEVEAMRASSHNGRWGTARHNGRDFALEKAGHIDGERTLTNVYWYWDESETDDDDFTEEKRMAYASKFAGSELRYYERQFGEALQAQNERHIAARHRDRVKSMSEWMKAKQYCPEETILQIGDKNAHVDPNEFAECVDDLIEWLNGWNDEYGKPFQILNIAIHLDETSPHAHMRRVWQYQNEDGVWCVGQNKALEAAGVDLPESDKKISANNNRKITFDAMVREKWLDICEEHGFVIEREADSKHSVHIQKEEWIALQEERKKLELEKAKIKLKESKLAKDKKSIDKEKEYFALQKQKLEETQSLLDDMIHDLKAEPTADSIMKTVLDKCFYLYVDRLGKSHKILAKDYAEQLLKRRNNTVNDISKRRQGLDISFIEKLDDGYDFS